MTKFYREYLQNLQLECGLKIATHFCIPYFRIEYFQYLIEINKKGLSDNTNIFPSQIIGAPLIDILLKH